jgi:hypothetical protein
MDISTQYIAATIHRERLAEAEQARQWAQRSVTIRLRDRVRQALSVRLIAWGEWLQVPQTPIKAR